MGVFQCTMLQIASGTSNVRIFEMNRIMNQSVLTLFLLILAISCSTKKTSEAPDIVYLEENSPDSIPQIFGKDVVSVEGRLEMGFTISPNGKSIAF